MEKVRIEQHSVGGLLWLIGWLFTIGFLRGAAALVAWPPYLGYALSPLLTTLTKVASP